MPMPLPGVTRTGEGGGERLTGRPMRAQCVDTRVRGRADPEPFIVPRRRGGDGA
ncbi:hypothetical protein [Actinoplanes philippinensis]|uniref:hypothetical protein n=1 Tax=Actinoplanes philippinensis TaxID=35752 RepID=UPI0033DB2834